MKKNEPKMLSVSMSTDVIHNVHINILKEAKKYGNVIVILSAKEQKV